VKKILILMSRAGGGGHQASAEALRDAFNERYGARLQVDMVDLWQDHTFPPLNQIPKSYRFLVDDAPWLYKFFYKVGEKPQAMEPLFTAASRVLSRPISQVIHRSNPDLIVSVHPLMQEIPLRILRRMRRSIPFVTVVTDLINAHALWFNKDVTLCFVASNTAYNMALQAGLRPEQLRLYGLPIRPAFARPPRPKLELRRELGMHPDAPAAIIVSGGEGMGRVAEIARVVAERLTAGSQSGGPPAGQLVVVCGRNEVLEQELRAVVWPIPTIVKGYVDNIWDWMAACDCIITKAGPGSIAEALALGMPIVLMGYIPGQETGNVPYVLRHGAGVYVEEPQQIAEVIAGWFRRERPIMAQFAQRAAQIGHPQATFQIVEEIAALVLG